jgi:hypothetical protein
MVHIESSDFLATLELGGGAEEKVTRPRLPRHAKGLCGRKFPCYNKLQHHFKYHSSFLQLATQKKIVQKESVHQIPKS